MTEAQMIERLADVDARWQSAVEMLAAARYGAPGDYRTETLARNRKAKKRRNRGLPPLLTMRQEMLQQAETDALELVATTPALAAVRAELDDAADLRAELERLQEARCGLSEESPERGVAQTANVTEAKGMETHRHNWNLIGRQPVGSVRRCHSCGACQIKRQRAEARDGVSILTDCWVPFDPSASAPTGAETDRPHPATGVSPQEAIMATATKKPRSSRAKINEAADAARELAGEAKATRRSEAAIAAAAKNEAPATPDAPAPVEDVTGKNPGEAFEGLFDSLFAEAKKLGADKTVQKGGYIRVNCGEKKVASIFKPGKTGVRVALTALNRGDGMTFYVVKSEEELATVLDGIKARVAAIKAPAAPAEAPAAS